MADSKNDEALRKAAVDDDEPDEWFDFSPHLGFRFLLTPTVVRDKRIFSTGCSGRLE
jgi:hypothetical protein